MLNSRKDRKVLTQQVDKTSCKENYPRFGEISPINLNTSKSPEDRSLLQLVLNMNSSPEAPKKRDIGSFLKKSVKYGLKPSVREKQGPAFNLDGRAFSLKDLKSKQFFRMMLIIGIRS